VTDGQAAALPAARKRRKATPQAPRARVESVLRDEAPERVSATTKSGLVKSWDW
jgi:hypothetical protein